MEIRKLFTPSRSQDGRSKIRLGNLLNLVLPGLLAVIVIECLGIAFFEVPHVGDAIEYLELAKNLHDHNFFSFDGSTASRMRQPLYPVFLSLTYYSLGESLLLVKIIQGVLGLLSFVGIMKLYHLICGKRYIGLVSLGIGVYVPLWLNCPGILSESLAIFVIVLFLLCLHRAIRDGDIKFFILSGVLMGLAILTRPIAISLLLFAWLPVVAQPELIGRRVKAIVAMSAACVLILIPWAVRNYYSCGTLSPLSAEGEFMALKAADLANNVPADSILTFEEISRSPSATSTIIGRTFDGIVHNPLAFTWNSISRLIAVWTYFPGSRDFFGNIYLRIVSHAVQALLLLAVLIGLVKLAPEWRWYVLYPAMSFSFVLFFAGEAKSRFLLPIMAPLLIAAAVGVIAFYDAIRWQRES